MKVNVGGHWGATRAAQRQPSVAYPCGPTCYRASIVMLISTPSAAKSRCKAGAISTSAVPETHMKQSSSHLQPASCRLRSAAARSPKSTTQAPNSSENGSPSLLEGSRFFHPPHSCNWSPTRFSSPRRQLSSGTSPRAAVTLDGTKSTPVMSRPMLLTNSRSLRLSVMQDNVELTGAAKRRPS